MTVTIATHINGRDYQEDRFAVKEIDSGTAHLLAVFDGHGGSEAANMCSQVIVPTYQRFSTMAQSIPHALRLTFSYLDTLTKDYNSGTTASVVIATPVAAYVAVIGDSPVIIKTDKGTIWLGPDHNVRTNREELQLAIGRGAYEDQGYIMLGNSGLQMSRAFGDRRIKKILDTAPEINVVPLGPNSFVLIGSDGITDPHHVDNKVTIQELASIADSPNSTAENIVQYAKDRKTGDNATAILLKF